jgi:chemotaxis protein methyltransferase CheR
VSIPNADFDFIRDLVRQRSAIVLESNKEYLAVTRLEPLARGAGLGSVSELVSHLRSEPNSLLHERVVEAMTTNETSFFRDLHPFESLGTDVLPAVMQANRASRVINIWSAACASGQEPYSVAMMLHEQFPELESWSVGILATDVSTSILQRAQSGRYGQIEMNRGLRPTCVKYFHRDGSHWQLDDSIRNASGLEHRLVNDWPSCRHGHRAAAQPVYFDRSQGRDPQADRNVLRPAAALLLSASRRRRTSTGVRPAPDRQDDVVRRKATSCSINGFS